MIRNSINRLSAVRIGMFTKNSQFGQNDHTFIHHID